MKNRELFRFGQYERSGSDYWLTPPDILADLEKKYGDYFDPCPRNPDFDGLEIDWPRHGWVYVNPPYSNITEWAKKAYHEHLKGCNVIMLIPARTDTRYFHDYINEKAEIKFIKGRLKYVNPITGESKGSAPFPSIFCIWEVGSKHWVELWK
jgi:site-specific DNA-methyltransferase (adenine-specific)